MAAGSHLSIGEVLSLVQDEFPDVTISKIRFLESQGLLDPERTPSGYRKFYQRDIERLEWILTQQRDSFLPLKVIRQRLDEWDATGERPAAETAALPAESAPDDGVTAPASPTPQQRTPDARTADKRTGGVAGPGTESSGIGAFSTANRSEGDDLQGRDDLDGAPARHPAAGATTAPDRAATSARRAAASLAAASAEEVLPTPSTPTDTAEPGSTGDANGSPAPTTTGGRWGSVHGLTVDELAAEAGISAQVVEELQSYSLISGRTVGGEDYFDDAAVDIARASRTFIDRGIEVRHLRMYKVSAQREAGVLEQLVMPVLKQRNPAARTEAVDLVNSLAEAGRQLHEALLQMALDDALS